MFRSISSPFCRQARQTCQTLTKDLTLTRSFSSAPDQPGADGFIYGTVTNYLRPKQFGFIKADVSGEKYYVHRNKIVGADAHGPHLRAKEKVRFTLRPSPTNASEFQAINVTYADGSHIPLMRDKIFPKAKITKNRDNRATRRARAASPVDEPEDECEQGRLR